LIIVLWRTNFKSIPFEVEQCLQQYNCYSCLDVETSCRDVGCRGVRRVSDRTLYFVNSGEVASDEMLLMTCLQERFLQTRFFRHISSDAFFSDTFFQTLLTSIKFLCSLTCSIRIFMNSTLIWILYTWTNV